MSTWTTTLTVMTRPAAGVRASRMLPAFVLVALACGGDVAGPGEGDPLLLELHGLRALDAGTEGTYEGWLIGDEGQAASAGRFTVPADGGVELESPVRGARSFLLTVEPPGDDDGAPSDLGLLVGDFQGGEATLDIVGAVTSGAPLEPEPGTHVLFTPSDNHEVGYPSHEDAGIWLFNIQGDTLDGSFYLDFTPLSRGWIYEGWLVRDRGTEDAVWLSYGKFEPDVRRKVATRDNTGLGPFSGQLEYRDALPFEVVFPGDDWIANPHGYPVPGDIHLPVDLNGCFRPPEECEAAGHEHGPSRWTHVITVEPRTDMEEEPWAAEPFLVRPYRNPIGEGPPEDPRTILYLPGELPGGLVRVGGG